MKQSVYQTYRLFSVGLFLVVFTTMVSAQIGKFTGVCKKPLKYQYPIEGNQEKNVCSDKKIDDYWVVYSDRDANVTYRDKYAQYPNGKIDFLTACYVVDEKNDFLELVKYDEKLLPPRKGFIPSILKKSKRYRFADLSQVEYVGWIHKSKLLLHNNAWVSPMNMKPLRYMLDIAHPSILVNRDKFFNEDTLITYKNPELTKVFVSEAEGAPVPSVQDMIYIYKQSNDKKKYLVGYSPSFTDDNLQSVYGWVDSTLVLKIGQQQILVPEVEKDSLGREKRVSEAFFHKNKSAQQYGAILPPDSVLTQMQRDSIRAGLFADSTYRFVDYRISINDESPNFFFNTNRQSEYKHPEKQFTYSTYHSFPVWDHSPNKVINIDGQFVFFNEFQELKKQYKKVNIVVLVETSAAWQTELLQLTNSIQKLYSILDKEELDGYKSTLGAVSYDYHSVVQSFPLGNIFPDWLDFVKDVADESVNRKETEQLGNGFEKALEKATEIIKGKEDETNVFIVVGATTAEYQENQLSSLVDVLADFSPRMFFYQVQNKSDFRYLDFIFKGKYLIDQAGRHAIKKKQKFIVDANLFKTELPFYAIDETKNLFLLDSPENCMHQGGVGFPKINEKLHPSTFDQLFETLMLQIAEHNSLMDSSLQTYFDGVGRTRSQTHPELIQELQEKGVEKKGIEKLSTTTYDDQYQMEFYGLEDSSELVFEHYYLLLPQEHESCVNHLKKLTPIPADEIKRKQYRRFRRRLYRAYKREFKFLNELFCKNVKFKEASIANLMFMGTGIAVNDTSCQSKVIKDIKRHKKLTDEEFRNFLLSIRSKIEIFEEYPIKNQDKKHTVQSLNYIYMPTKIIP